MSDHCRQRSLLPQRMAACCIRCIGLGWSWLLLIPPAVAGVPEWASLPSVSAKAESFQLSAKPYTWQEPELKFRNDLQVEFDLGIALQTPFEEAQELFDTHVTYGAGMVGDYRHRYFVEAVTVWDKPFDVFGRLHYDEEVVGFKDADCASHQLARSIADWRCQTQDWEMDQDWLHPVIGTGVMFGKADDPFSTRIEFRQPSDDLFDLDKTEIMIEFRWRF